MIISEAPTFPGFSIDIVVEIFLIFIPKTRTTIRRRKVKIARTKILISIAVLLLASTSLV